MSQLVFAGVIFYLLSNRQIQPVLTDAAFVEKIKTILVGTAAGMIVGVRKCNYIGAHFNQAHLSRYCQTVTRIQRRVEVMLFCFGFTC